MTASIPKQDLKKKKKIKKKKAKTTTLKITACKKVQPLKMSPFCTVQLKQYSLFTSGVF